MVDARRDSFSVASPAEPRCFLITAEWCCFWACSSTAWQSGCALPRRPMRFVTAAGTCSARWVRSFCFGSISGKVLAIRSIPDSTGCRPSSGSTWATRAMAGRSSNCYLQLAFDYRFGLFVSSPLMLLAVFCPFSVRRASLCPHLELAFILLLFVALWLFFSGSNYTRLQFNTGIRYMAPLLPFLFVPAAIVLMRLPRFAIYVIAVISVTESWCLAMYRDVERGFGVLDPILHVFLGGFQLPALTTLFHMGGQYGDFFRIGVSPLPLFAMAAAILYGVWSPR